MTTQERRYCEYIEQHVNNIYKAYQLINDKLHNDLDYDDLKLIKRINTHDMSKWSDEEFEGYRQKYYAVGKIDEEKYAKAWEHHYKNNDHHPEHYVFAYSFEHDEIKYLAGEMPDAAIAEMFCDWVAMSLYFRTSMREWYENESDFLFHPNTKKKVDLIISRDWVNDIHLQ